MTQGKPKDLKKQIVEVEAGDGAVVVRVTGELKIDSININPEMVDLIISKNEHWIKIAVRFRLAKV